MNHVKINKKNYPRQDEVQALIDWTEGLEKVYTSSCDISEDFLNKFKRADKIRQSLWRKVFGINSPWSVTIKGKNHKRTYYWNDEKARKLGI